MKPFLILICFCCIIGCKDLASECSIAEFSAEIENIQKNSAQDNVSEFRKKLSENALSIIDPNIRYTPDYISIPYPNGDVPPMTGVCTDVIIRTYRKMGIDLQKEVHEDMKKHFDSSPKLWGSRKTDTNIDHRRVPNLQTFFKRKGMAFTITQNPDDYQTGAIVTWMINDKLPHIGIVTDRLSKDGKRRLIVHNVGGGQVLEDCLFRYEITGLYVYESK